MTHEILCPVGQFNPRQTLFFVMSSRRNDARVVEVHILQADATRAARRMGSCVRVGYVQSGKAVCL